MFIINHLARPYNSDCSVYDDICRWGEILGIDNEEYIKKREKAYEIARNRVYITAFILALVLIW